MASILSNHSMGDTSQSENAFAKLARQYRAFVSLLRKKFARKSSLEKSTAFSSKGNIYMLQESRKTEEEILCEQKFSNEEIARLLKLREHYQNGGSDRAFIMRHLSFLRYLRNRDQISS